MSCAEVRRSNAGFTLLEILLVAALTVFVAVAVVASFTQGTRLYEGLARAQTFEEAAMLIERITRDVRNTFDYSAAPFEKSPDRMSLTRLDEGGAPLRVTYTFDRLKGTLLREARPLGPDAEEASREEYRLNGIASVQFDYEPAGAGVPRRVDVSIRLVRKGEGETRLLTRRIRVPLGYARP